MTGRDHTGMAGSSLEASYDMALLGRLGRALAHVYDDTVRSSLPPALQALVDKLENALPAEQPCNVAADRMARR
jgi:hypothetical protein